MYTRSFITTPFSSSRGPPEGRFTRPPDGGRWSLLSGMRGVRGPEVGRQHHAHTPPWPLDADPQHTRTPPCEGARTRAPRARSGGEGQGGGCIRVRAKRCAGGPLPRGPLSGYALQRPAEPHDARNQQVREENDASIPLHTLQGLSALARIKVPGGVSGFLFFLVGEKNKQTIFLPGLVRRPTTHLAHFWSEGRPTPVGS